MIQETKSVSRVVLRDNILDQIKHAELYKTFREMLTPKYNAQEQAFFKETWIAFSLNGKKGYWNKEVQVAVPVQCIYAVLEDNYFDIECAEITEETIVSLFDSESECPDEIMQGIKASQSFQNGHWIGFTGGSFCVETERYANWNDTDSVQVGYAGISEDDFIEAILSEKYEILTDDTLKQAVAVLKQRSVAEVSEEDIDSLLKIFKIDRKKIEKEVNDKVMKNFVMTPEIAEFYIQSLLECDTIRANLEKYDKKCLTDVNSGHWELWSDGEPKAAEGQVLAELEQPLRARNPMNDIHENGLIGIDFGTKSTIVSVQDGQEHTTLLRVGIGKLNKAPEAHHYENPTIMEFLNLDKFLRDYASRTGRPETSIDDLRVSHAADKDLKSCDNNSFFDSFFYDIKQWCGDDRRSAKIIDQQKGNTERELPPFVSLKEGDFNPLELYAYYLGLYINNMHEGIYLDYVISFPVTYKLDVKNKILESFRAGLWKSLPETIQNNETASKKFRVRMGVSEPEAYAITALQGYGFDPEDENEKYLYSIFDFGGGTTDFDFGIWRGADDTVREEEDKDYVIEHLNTEGDKYLGGENLLELLAFEIFKANNDFMRTGKQAVSEDDQTESVGFSFTLPPECVKPSGCETTIKNTPSAKRNTKQLMEALRPFWEGIIGIADKNSESAKGKKQKAKEDNAEEPKSENPDTIEYNGYIFGNNDMIKNLKENGTVTVSLFDNNGDMQAEQTLFVRKKDLISVDLIRILEERIERGVKHFFSSVMLLFDNKTVENSGVDEIQIFLAGNSSKSPILQKLFTQYIQQENEKINGGKSGDTHFYLFPPLGTAEAMELQKQNGLPINTDITAPTGKTGVAYGLIQGREGGPIRVISRIQADSQSKFMFNIGKARKGKFSMVLDRNEAIYGQWVRFGVASSEDFEIYYTSLPSAGKMPVTDAAIHKIRCRILVPDADADIYIRTIEEAPEDLEYCVAKEKAPDETAEVIRVHLAE
ncbi:MAG: hypothetical protein PUB89_15525 [Oscillospiraceae bacterium]|nr:hypothetical protein [Oscillospiraceae bacterium]